MLLFRSFAEKRCRDRSQWLLDFAIAGGEVFVKSTASDLGFVRTDRLIAKHTDGGTAVEELAADANCDFHFVSTCEFGDEFTRNKPSQLQQKISDLALVSFQLGHMDQKNYRILVILAIDEKI
jgi:hypothetical protein